MQCSGAERVDPTCDLGPVIRETGRGNVEDSGGGRIDQTAPVENSDKCETWLGEESGRRSVAFLVWQVSAVKLIANNQFARRCFRKVHSSVK